MQDSEEYFRPTARQRKLKAAFRSVCKTMPRNRTDITLAFVKQHISSSDVDNWWTVPGFIAWFRREESVAERMQYLYQLRLDSLEDILESDDGTVTSRDKLAAGAELDKIAKTLSEAANMVEKKDSRTVAERVKEEMELARLPSQVEIAEGQAVNRPAKTPVTMPEFGND
jgi:hypothetical protein